MNNPDKPDRYHKVTTITATRYNITGLQDGKSYDFRVKAVNKIGESEPSSVPEHVTPKDILGNEANLLLNIMI